MCQGWRWWWGTSKTTVSPMCHHLDIFLAMSHQQDQKSVTMNIANKNDLHLSEFSSSDKEKEIKPTKKVQVVLQHRWKTKSYFTLFSSVKVFLPETGMNTKNRKSEKSQFLNLNIQLQDILNNIVQVRTKSHIRRTRKDKSTHRLARIASIRDGCNDS